MISVTLLQPSEGTPLQTGGEELISAPGPKWIDVQSTSPEELGRLASLFALHRLAVEDCLHLDQRPKLEEYPGHLFVVLQSFSNASSDLCQVTLHETHFFIGPDWLISVHELENGSVQAVRQKLRDDPKVATRGPDFVAYLLMDTMVDQHFPIFDAFSEEVDVLETELFEDPRPHQLQRLFELKRTLARLRRVLSPQRDVVGQLARSGLPNIGERTLLYYRDAYDHLVRVHEQVENARETLGNLVDAYLSMVANRTNEISKQLTIFATLFLPLSFVSGFFGQNFEQLSRPFFFHLMLVLTLAIPLGLLAWFRARKWM